MARKDKATSFDDSYSHTIGEELRHIRQEKGLSLTDMAKLLGYTKGYLSGIENGHVQPSQELLKSYERKVELTAIEMNKLSRTQFLGMPHTNSESLPHLRSIPYLRNRFFTGRRDILERLHLTLAKSSQVPSACAIIGLGGIGKTQVALEYLHRSQRNYQGIFWLKADSFETFSSSLIALAEILDLPEKDGLNREQVIAMVKRWLKEHTENLIIIDGLDNPEDIEFVYDFLPQVSGHVILTSRTQALMQDIPCIQIEKMPLEEGALFLLRRTEIISFDGSLIDAPRTELNNALEISRHLDGLPLALEQAGAFIKEIGCDLSGYLHLYQSHRNNLLSRRSELVTGYAKPVATTWSLSFERIEHANCAAADLLRVCAFLYPSIPEDVFTIGAAELGPILQAVAPKLFEVNIAIAELVKYSFLRRNPHDKTLTIHKLVQTVLQDSMNQETQNLWIARAYKAVNVAFPFGRDFSKRRSHYYHLYAFLQHTLTLQMQIQGSRHLEVGIRLADLAELYRVRAEYEKAENLFQQALSIQREALGFEHPHVAITLSKFARLYRAISDYASAKSLYQQAITIQEKTLGSEDPQIAKCLWGLAKLNHTLGEYDEAEKLCKRALYIQEQHLAPDHIDLAYTLNILAEVYRSTGKQENAEILYQRALDIWEKEGGPEDSHVALILSKLAEVYSDQDKHAEAKSLLLRSLEIREKVLEPDHPYMAFSLDNLGTIYYFEGEYNTAESMYKRALLIREQKLGPYHIYTAITHNNLGRLYTTLEKYDLAELHYKKALEIREKKFGLDHPKVADILESYADLLKKLNKIAEAMRLESRAKLIRTRHNQKGNFYDK